MALRIAVAITDVVSADAQHPCPPALLPAYLPVVINSDPADCPWPPSACAKLPFHIGLMTGKTAVAKDDGVAAPLRVVVADDDVLLREGLASLLGSSGFDVVGQAGDGAQLLALVRDKTPELVVADIRMPPTHTTEGLDAARVIREELPDIAILVLSAHVDVEHAMELLASGHSIGYLLKSRVTDVADFVETLERIAKGASVVDPALVSGVGFDAAAQ